LIVIREIKQTEAGPFWSLRLEALRNHPTAFGSSYEEAKDTSLEGVRERLSSNEGQFVLGAYSDDGSRLIGMVGFKRESSLKARHKAFIWGMYVTSEYRRQGVGRLLMEELLTRASAMEGLKVVILSVVTVNASAGRLYRSLGFETYGVERCALQVEGVCIDEEHMAKRLAAETGTTSDPRILEIALLSVKAGQTKAFEASFRQASAIISGMNGYVSHELRKCIEDGHKYALLVQWETLEAHTIGFRESPQYQQWRAMLHHYYDPFPVVEHYEANLLTPTNEANGEAGAREG
jgi:heme-degrading monooxygenase HmoA/ribosomal protein S18 acetylase RimI-like enzyme